MTIVGTATFGEVEGIPGFTVVAAEDATAQAMFAQPGSYDSIVVASDGSTTNDELATAVQAAVGSDDLEILTGDADTADKQATFKEDMSFFNTFLLAFAYIALFVGMFIIYNTFSIIIAQRMREMAMLRAVGASRRQVLRAVLLESAIVGTVASARRPGRPAWACRSGCGRSSERSASTSPAATWSSRPARSSRPSWSVSP